MFFSSKGFYTGAFLLVFLMTLIIGVASEVSLSASFTRAIYAGGFFTVLTWVVGKVISTYVFPPGEIDDVNPKNENLGTNVDLTITESVTDNGKPPVDPAGGQPSAAANFTPLTARQIDPQVNKIISSDPQKVADIVRKMGFGEEE